MNQNDFIQASASQFPGAIKLTYNPIVWSVIDSIYHSKRMEKRLGVVDTHKQFIRWLALNSAIFYRMVRMATGAKR